MTRQNDTVAIQVSKPWQKLLIGFIGGLCAAIFPRLIATLALYDTENIVLINMGYLGIAVLFATLVGAVVMIMEWGVAKEPRATFMTALGIPALVAGALNTSSGAAALDQAAKENKNLAELVANMSQITEIPPADYSPSSDAGKHETINLLGVLGINNAYARDGEVDQSGMDLNPAIQMQQKKYFIVLEQAQSEPEARQKANALNALVPGVKIIRAGNQYLVIEPKQLPRSEAIIKAYKLKSDHQLNTKLFQAK